MLAAERAVAEGVADAQQEALAAAAEVARRNFSLGFRAGALLSPCLMMSAPARSGHVRIR